MGLSVGKKMGNVVKRSDDNFNSILNIQPKMNFDKLVYNSITKIHSLSANGKFPLALRNYGFLV